MEDSKQINEPKMNKTKKILIIIGLAVDMIATVLLLVLSIILLVRIDQKPALESATDGFSQMLFALMDNPNLFLGAVVVPLFILLVLNIFLTFFYYRKQTEKEKKAASKDVSLDNLTDAQKQALIQSLLNDTKKSEEDKK